MTDLRTDFGLGIAADRPRVPAPELPYRPAALRGESPGIALIACHIYAADAGKLARQLCHSAFLPTSTDTGNGAGNQFNQPGSVLADKGKNNRRIQW